MEGDRGNSFALRPDLKARWDDAHSAGRLLDYIGHARIPVFVGWPAEGASSASATAAGSTTGTASSAATLHHRRVMRTAMA